MNGSLQTENRDRHYIPDAPTTTMQRPIDSILVTTDGSEGAEAGVRRGIDLAATVGADLHVLSVVDTREIEPPGAIPDDRSERVRLIEDEAEGSVATVADVARTHLSGAVTTAVERDIPVRGITEYADAHDVDLIAMGTHGRSGLERVFLGSVTEKVLRTASVPVLAVPPGADVGDHDPGEIVYEDVLLPTDGSDGAAVAVDWGVDLATVYDATVHTVYSVDTNRVGGEGTAEIYDALERSGQDAVEAVRERAREADVSARGYIGSGPAARTIRTYSEEHDVDLIVMGTHGRSGLERYLIGSVTETVVRSVDLPVCCVPLGSI
jgi:nucleotide-binding universal stress UspA family protein